MNKSNRGCAQELSRSPSLHRDMREANKAIKREKHLMPTINDLVADFNGATLFSKLDLSSGYHQLELAPKSRHITTSSTHVGLRRYCLESTLPPRSSRTVEEILTGLPGCRNISDDITVYGKLRKSLTRDSTNSRTLLKTQDNPS